MLCNQKEFLTKGQGTDPTQRPTDDLETTEITNADFLKWQHSRMYCVVPLPRVLNPLLIENPIKLTHTHYRPASASAGSTVD